MPAEHARSVQTTWNYTLVSIVFFVGFLDGIVILSLMDSATASPHPLMVPLIVMLVMSSGVQLRFCWFLRVGRGGGLPAAGWTIALMVSGAVVWVLGLLVPGSEVAAAVPLWVAASLIACLLPNPWRRVVLAGGVALAVAHVLIATFVLGEPIEVVSGAGWFLIVLYSALLPVMFLTSLWWWEIVVQLDRHRRTAAELAVTQERLRFASDLHDIQGHHLQVISLKSELAERLLEVDPDAARALVHETRLIAKEALEETRSLVAGYRQVALDDELENAREVLRAAGASCALRVSAVPADPAVRSVLASVVREATTNILRHSEATRVTITLGAASGSWVLSVENDGVGEADAAAGHARPGSGVAGLRARLAGVGGVLETSADASAGTFALRAAVPAGVGAPAGVEVPA